MMKNKLYIYSQNRKLSCFHPLKTDRNSSIISKINKYNKELERLQEEKESLNYDLSLIKDSIRAASKISNEETPSQEEKESFTELKDNYPDFFDSEEDEEQEETTSLLNRIMNVKDYLKKEVKANKKSINLLEKQKPTLKQGSIDQIIQSGESSKQKQSSITEQGESSKSKNEDNFPYNPFDDIGTD